MKRITTILTTILILCFATVSWGAGLHLTGLTPADSRCSFASGDSWIQFDGEDFSAYADKFFIRLTDGSGLIAEGYAGSVGTGETFGGKLVNNGTFTAWTIGGGDDPNNDGTPDGWSVTAEDANNLVKENPAGVCNVVSNDTAAVAIHQNIVVGTGKLYKLNLDITINTLGWRGSFGLIGLGIANYIDSGNLSYYGVNPLSSVNTLKFYRHTDGPSDTEYDNISLKQVTEPAATGIHILDGKNGSSGWAKIESGFNYNDIVEIEILPAATLAGVTLTGTMASPSAPVNSWDLATDLIDRTGNIHGTETHAGTNRTRVNPISGLIEDVGAHVARFELAGGYRALLIEPAGENLIEYSHEFRDGISGWVNNNLTVTDDDIVGPDGTTDADKLVEPDDVGQVHRAYFDIAHAEFTDDTSVTFSVYALQGERTWTRLAMKTKANDWAATYFDLANGVVGDGTSDSSGIESASGGFYRVWITSDIKSGETNPSFQIQIAESGAVYSYDGVAGNGIYLWGAMVQESPIPTSYIATSGATVTRATESGEPHFTLPTGLFDAKGTAIVWWRPGYAESVCTTAGGILSSYDGIASLLFNKETDNNAIRSYDAKTAANSSVLDWFADTWYKLILKWGYSIGGQEKFRVGVDSGSGVSWGTEVDFDGAYSTGASIRLGYGLFSRMHLRGLRLYKDVLTDIEINRE